MGRDGELDKRFKSAVIHSYKTLNKNVLAVNEQLSPMLQNTQKSKWIEDLNRSPETTKFLEENKISKLLDNDFLDLMPKTKATETKIKCENISN